MKITLPATLAGREFAVIDVEGNGQQPPEIIDLAVLPISGTTPAAVTDLRSWLVRPCRPITHIVTRKVHGITNDDVAQCPPWQSIAPEVADSIDGRIVIAHNASVERRVLGAHLPGWRPPLILDTLRLAKAVWPDLDGYGLDRLLTHAAITPPDIQPGQRRHRAAYDVWITAELFRVLTEPDGREWEQIVDAAHLPGTGGDAGPRPQGANDVPGGLW